MPKLWTSIYEILHEFCAMMLVCLFVLGFFCFIFFGSRWAIEWVLG